MAAPPPLKSGPLSIPVPAEERDTIKVNNANATDLKNACDDALKWVRYSSHILSNVHSMAVRCLLCPNSFKQIYLHTDAQLTLGWAGVLVAAATGLHGWKVDFEQAEPAMRMSRQRPRIVLVSNMHFFL